MGNKLTSKIILEGTRLTFKTEIAFELNEHPGIVYAGSNIITEDRANLTESSLSYV